MLRTLTAQDRASLIRLASSLPVGDAKRKAILAGLAQTKNSSYYDSDPHYDEVSASEVADAIFEVSESAQRRKAILSEWDLIDMASRGFRHRVDVEEIEDVILKAIEILIKSGYLKKTPHGYRVV